MEPLLLLSNKERAREIKTFTSWSLLISERYWLAKKFIRVFHAILWKNLDDLFVQPNSFHWWHPTQSRGLRSSFDAVPKTLSPGYKAVWGKLESRSTSPRKGDTW